MNESFNETIVLSFQEAQYRAHAMHSLCVQPQCFYEKRLTAFGLRASPYMCFWNGGEVRVSTQSPTLLQDLIWKVRQEAAEAERENFSLANCFSILSIVHLTREASSSQAR